MTKPLHPFHPTEVAEAERPRGHAERFAAEISAYTAKQRKREQRANAAVPVLGPTPERMAKVDAFEEILVPLREAVTRPGTKVTRLQTVLEAQKMRLPEHYRIALLQVLEDFNRAVIPSASGVSSYGDGGARAPGPRSGGVPDHVREAFARILVLKARMGEELFVDLLAYVVEEANEERRRMMARPWTDKATLKGLFCGWDLAKLDSLAKMVLHIQRTEQALEGRKSSDTEIRARIQAKREREARKQR